MQYTIALSDLLKAQLRSFSNLNKSQSYKEIGREGIYHKTLKKRLLLSFS